MQFYALYDLRTCTHRIGALKMKALHTAWSSLLGLSSAAEKKGKSYVERCNLMHAHITLYQTL